MFYSRLFIVMFTGTVLLFNACSVHRLHKKKHTITYYEEALAQYEAKNYHTALGLFQEAMPEVRGKSTSASVYYHLAACCFYLKQYKECAIHAKYFYTAFLQDPRTEEALYMHAYSMYSQTKELRRCQNNTEKAITLLQDYLDRYPLGIHQEDAHKGLQDLKKILENKAFLIAKGYYMRKQYSAAVFSLNDFCESYKSSSYLEQAMHLRSIAQYSYYKSLIKCKKIIQQEVYQETQKYCEEYLDMYPQGSYVESVRTILNTIKNQPKTIKS